MSIILLIENQKDFENWMKDQPQDARETVAVWAALVVFPFATYSGYNIRHTVKIDDIFKTLTLLTARAILTSGVKVNMPASDIVIGDSVVHALEVAARTAADVVMMSNSYPQDSAGNAACNAARVAANAVRSVNNTVNVVQVVNSATVTAGNYAEEIAEDNARAAGNDIDAGALGKAAKAAASMDVYSDIFMRVEIKNLPQTAVWQERSRPEWRTRLIRGLGLLNKGLEWSFWREWYQGFLDGKPMDWELQRRVAMISDPIWEAGPEAVAEEIERIRAAYDVEKALRQLQEERVAFEKVRLGIGGNNPPDSIEDVRAIEREITIIWNSVEELTEEVKSESPNKGRVLAALDWVQRGLAAILKWCGRKGDLTVDTLIKWGIPAGGGYLTFNPDKIGALIEAVQAWLPFL